RSTCCSRRRAQSTSWTGAMSISPGSMCCTWPEPSSSPAPNRTWMLIGSIPPPQTARLASFAIKPSRWTATTPPSITPNTCGASASGTPKRERSWQVELFFKWIKQHLRIKRFFGTSENAVKTQIWIAVSVYVLVAIVKKRLTLDASLYTLLQILSVTLFEKMPIHQALAQDDSKCDTLQITNQLNLFAY